MELINHTAEKYVQQYTSALDEVLAQIEHETNATHDQPHMLSGHVQGKFLEMLSLMIRPKHILEIGTFTGFSAICLAKGLQNGGVLHTIELRQEDADTAKKYFD